MKTTMTSRKLMMPPPTLHHNVHSNQRIFVNPRPVLRYYRMTPSAPPISTLAAGPGASAGSVQQPNHDGNVRRDHDRNNRNRHRRPPPPSEHANTNTIPKTNILNDYATRYEHLLHQQRNLYRSKSGANASTSASACAGAILSNHAAMAGMLQCAMDAARKSPNVDGDTVESIACLLDETLYMQNYGSYSYIDGDGTNGNCNVMGGILTEFALELEEKQKQKQPQDIEDVDKDLDMDMGGFDSDAEVDAFFEEYPECKVENPIMNSFEVRNDNDNSDDSIDSGNKASKRATTGVGVPNSGNSGRMSMTNNPYRNNQQTIVSSSTRAPQASHAQSWDDYDAMNAERSNYNGYQMPVSTSRSLDPRSSYEQQQQERNQKQKQNPFRTAKEFKMSGNSDNDKNMNGGGGYGNNNHDTHDFYAQPQQQHQYPQRNLNSRFDNDEDEQSMSTYNPNRPNLSAGLKRKFQRPKIGSNANNTNGNGGGGNRTASSASNGRSRGSTGCQVSRPVNKHNEDGDEEELPEELKGLDKELIAKIENEIVDSGDSITFKDIAGLKEAKQTVMELVCWPMKRPDLFTGLRRGPNGLLLFGPPGTGKTLIGKAIAHESGATFFSISSSSLTSKWIGEGEKLVRTLFAVAAYREPAVVFIDEIDSLLTQRKADENEASRRIKTEFLVQLDGTGTSGQGRVLAIGATNRPHELDDAARRRFVKRLYIPLPEAPDREVLLRTLLLKNRHSLSDKEIAKLSNETKGFSGADLKALCTDAALGPIRQLGAHALEIDAKDVPPISYKHFRHALKGMNPSVAQSDLDIYMEFDKTYGSKSVSADAYDGMSDDESEAE